MKTEQLGCQNQNMCIAATSKPGTSSNPQILAGKDQLPTTTRFRWNQGKETGQMITLRIGNPLNCQHLFTSMHIKPIRVDAGDRWVFLQDLIHG